MHFYLLLVTLTLVNAGIVTDTKCDGVIIDGHYHEKETLKTGLRYPRSLAVDYNLNIIYFGYYNQENPFLGTSALFDLNTKEFKDINTTRFEKKPAVDQNTHDVYIGASEGIYKYDYKNHEYKLDVAIEISVNSLFIKDVIYFCEQVSLSMYTYIDGNIERFKDMEDTKVSLFVIDGEDVMFYSNDTGFYAQRKGGKDAVLYSKEDVSALTIDVHGNAYMCTNHAIYKVNKMKMSVDKLTDVDWCRGLTIDGYNNIIYSDFKSIVRFIKIPKIC